MSTLEELRRGIAHAWDSLAEGWRDFTARAGDALTRFNPIHRVDDDGSQDDSRMAAAARWGVLAAEVTVGDDDVALSLEVPGMNPDDFHIDIVEEVLVIRGEKRIERDSTRGRIHVMERAYGQFERAIRLPVAVDPAGAQANYERGVLRVRIPRAAHARGRRIEVRAGG